MIQNPNVLGRRILDFPAIHPCEEISPKTLVSALISLANEICSFKSRFFACNDRNAREIIRQIGVLLAFLEEVRGSVSDLPDAVVLGFSEIHFAFQRVRFLLEDCSREGARVLMLVNAERVANHFRVFARAIATALDVLPLSLIDVPVDLKEHVELVMRQARKSSFDVSSEDKRVLSVVRSVLNGFEKGAIPEMDDLRLVLDYLGIRRWSSCNKEVKFLGSEIEFENSNEERKELVTMLSSLMAFVCYCRCVLFDVVDGEANRQLNNKCSTEMLMGLNTDDFRCPISLEIMVDPVTIASGHTYDRSSIAKWFCAGNSICPKTSEKLKNLEMVTNLALRRLIQQYCFENGIPFVDSGHRNRHVKREVFAGSLAAENAMKMVANFLADKLSSETGQEKNMAAYEARLLSKTSVFNRSCLVEAGVVPPLLKLLLSLDSSTQENAAASLLNFSKHSKSKATIVNNGGLKVLVDVLKKGLNLEARQHAAGVLFYLASVEENRMLIGENPETIPALMELIENGTDRGKKNALVAIFGLLASPGNHWRVLAAGTVPLLVNLLKTCETEELITDSLAILATLAEKSDGTTAILVHKALDLAVEILNSSTSRAGKEYCVSLLLALCKNGKKDVVALLVKSPSLMGSLYSLLSEGTSRASKKASALIRVLHDFKERRSSGLVAPVLPRERFVRVW
ncbi:U-box domain-containing protein 18 [Morus notabilis]|uniref:RING-type E3 ubiquitin transferase n=1 Tax=Morus notabilis TaxID=981085 RepID=W9RKZ7_9ROSA|nr:U-box domain-containing protein 18 [Morus notabilis]EXB82615.1 U-box domain-containing protein 18 [Morus notabilis]